MTVPAATIETFGAVVDRFRHRDMTSNETLVQFEFELAEALHAKSVRATLFPNAGFVRFQVTPRSGKMPFGLEAKLRTVTALA